MTATNTKIITGSTLIDGNGGTVLKNPAIVIEGDRIKSIGEAGKVKVPKGAEKIDAKGCTLMPGMMDLHIHLCMFNNRTFKNYRVAQWEVTPELQQMYAMFHGQMCFEMGFTTLRDLGFVSSRGLMTSQLCAVRDSIDAGIFAGPRMLVGGFTYMTGAHLDLILPRAAMRPGFQSADGPWELRKLARTNLRDGCDVIKTCASGGGGTDKEDPDIRNMTQEELDAIVDEAHALHKPAAVHCFTPEAHRMAVKAGCDTIEHMVFYDDDSLEKILEAEIPMTPTLAHRTDHAIEIRREMGTPKFVLEKMKTIQPDCYKTFQVMHKAGIKIAMGTDMGYEPSMGQNAYELEIYVDLGMTPMEAIQTTTKNAAEAANIADDLGTIEPGKLADIVAVDGDPLDDIRILQERKKIQIVMKEGNVFVDRRPNHSKEIINVEDKSWKIIDA
ncbi:MAG TPA: amidohydrolase family protein [Rhodospirillales bacterium]|jgi:imidazolonepropionase-like amidohydrolase|nr:amidohydrolase family protein [Rhodospirillales bacterium]